MGAEKGAQGFRDGEGDEQVRPGQLFVQVVLKPLLGCMMLALGTVAVATRRIDAVLVATALARREAVAIMPALAMLDGLDGLSVRGWQMGIALKICRGKGVEEVTQGGHGRSPGISELMRV